MRKWIPLAFILVAVALSVVVAPRLPASIATHWDWMGQVNGRSPRWLALSVIPAAMILIVALLYGLPRLDPMRENFQKFWPEYQLIVAAVTGMMLVMHAAIIANALSWRVDIIRISAVLTGALFVMIGNVMPRLRRNHIAGFRTRATLSSDRIWARVHRVGGAIMVVTGILMALAAFAPVPWSLAIMIALALVSGIGLLIYSSRISGDSAPPAPPSP